MLNRFIDRFISMKDIWEEKIQTKILVLSFLCFLLLMDYSGEIRFAIVDGVQGGYLCGQKYYWFSLYFSPIF